MTTQEISNNRTFFYENLVFSWSVIRFSAPTRRMIFQPPANNSRQDQEGPYFLELS